MDMLYSECNLFDEIPDRIEHQYNIRVLIPGIASGFTSTNSDVITALPSSLGKLPK